MEHCRYEKQDIPFGTVSESQNKLKHETEDITIFENVVHNWGRLIAERPTLVLVRRTRSSHQVDNDGTGEPVGSCALSVTGCLSFRIQVLGTYQGRTMS